MNINNQDIKKLVTWFEYGTHSKLKDLVLEVMGIGISWNECIGKITGEQSLEEKIKILKNMIIKKDRETYFFVHRN